MGIIYKITSPSNRIYVGKTNDFRKRLNAHKSSVTKSKKQHIILINSFKKYGFDEHIFEIIEECDNSILDEREIYWIKELNTFNMDNPLGMNMTLGGDGQRGKLDERRKSIAINNWFKNGHPFKGKHHTEENKKASSIRVKKYNLENNVKVPKWGVEKSRLKKIKSVLCYDVDGNYLMEFESYTTAGKWLKKPAGFIRDAVKRESCTLGKYFFVDKTENYPLKIETKGIAFANSKRKVLYLDTDLNIIKEYPSALEASEELKVPKTTINRAAQYNNLKPTRQGHIFYYSDKWNYY
jgi:group I intron endonuclease